MISYGIIWYDAKMISYHIHMILYYNILVFIFIFISFSYAMLTSQHSAICLNLLHRNLSYFILSSTILFCSIIVLLYYCIISSQVEHGQHFLSGNTSPFRGTRMYLQNIFCPVFEVAIYLFIYLFIYLSISLHIYLSIYLSLYLSIYLSNYPSIYLSMKTSILFTYSLFDFFYSAFYNREFDYYFKCFTFTTLLFWCFFCTLILTRNIFLFQ